MSDEADNGGEERTRITSRPPPGAPSPEIQEFGAVVAGRLTTIDGRLDELQLAVLAMSKNLTILQSTAESIYAMLADEVLAVRHENLELAHGLKQLEARVSILETEEHGPNGNGKWEGK